MIIYNPNAVRQARNNQIYSTLGLKGVGMQVKDSDLPLYYLLKLLLHFFALAQYINRMKPLRWKPSIQHFILWLWIKNIQHMKQGGFLIKQ